MSEVHIYAPPPVCVWIERECCPNCQRRRRMVFVTYKWYGGRVTCLRCGDAWDEDGRCERPFARGWRPKAIRAAWSAYVRYVASGKSASSGNVKGSSAAPPERRSR
jgi:hypothetical protein